MKRLPLAIATSLAAAGLVACSKQPDPTPAPQASGHASGMAMPSTGDPDADFLRAMIPHHQGAIDMAREELAKGTDSKVRALATAVISTQQAEISQMEGWLAERGRSRKAPR